VNFYIRDLHYRAYRNIERCGRIHPGFLTWSASVRTVHIKHKEQGCHARRSVGPDKAHFSWIAGVVRRRICATRQGIRSIVREELDARDERSGR
jgi:hypothetical protein